MSDETIERQAIPEAFGLPHVFTFAVIEGLDVDLVFRVTRAETTLGRGDEADYKINDPESSKKHLSISVIGSVLSVVDLRSKNGTLLNDRALSPGVRQRLKNLDEIQIGATRLLFMTARCRGTTR